MAQTHSPLVSLGSPVLIVGAAYSGKSALANSALKQNENAVVLGTTDSSEEAFAPRLTELKAQRPAGWQLVEPPAFLDGSLARTLGSQLSTKPQVLVDSLSQWLATMLVQDASKYSLGQMEKRIDAEIYTLEETLRRERLPEVRIVLVSSEVGSGTVPQSALERLFRQSVGRLNMRIAEVCATVVQVVAGIPVVIKK